MGFFASLCGTDILHPNQLAKLHDSLAKPIFESAATLTRAHYSDAAKLAAAYHFDVDTFRQSVASYDIGYLDQNVEQSRLWREAFGSATVLTYLTPYIQSLSFCAFDHRHKRLMNILELLVPLFARQLGVVHNGQSDAFRPLRTRLSHDTHYILHRVDAVFPECK